LFATKVYQFRIFIFKKPIPTKAQNGSIAVSIIINIRRKENYKLQKNSNIFSGVKNPGFAFEISLIQVY